MHVTERIACPGGAAVGDPDTVRSETLGARTTAVGGRARAHRGAGVAPAAGSDHARLVALTATAAAGVVLVGGERTGQMSQKKITPALAYLRTSSAANVGPDNYSDRRQRDAIRTFAAGDDQRRLSLDVAEMSLAMDNRKDLP